MMEGLSLADMCAVVTGGSRGIGRAVCLELARLGARVVFTYAGNAEAAQKTLEMIEEQGGVARAICADVRSAEDATRVIDEAPYHFWQRGYPCQQRRYHMRQACCAYEARGF